MIVEDGIVMEKRTELRSIGEGIHLQPPPTAPIQIKAAAVTQKSCVRKRGQLTDALQAEAEVEENPILKRRRLNNSYKVAGSVEKLVKNDLSLEKFYEDFQPDKEEVVLADSSTTPNQN